MANHYQFNQERFNQGPVSAGTLTLQTIKGSSIVTGSLTVHVLNRVTSSGIHCKSTVTGDVDMNYAGRSVIYGQNRTRVNIYMSLSYFGITYNGIPITLSNINRSEDITYRILSVDNRSSTGKMRRRVINHKKSFQFGWTWLPYLTADVRDGGAGGKDLLAMFQAGGVVSLSVIDGPNGEMHNYNCMVDQNGFKRQIQFIGAKEFWDLTLSLSEV